MNYLEEFLREQRSKTLNTPIGVPDKTDNTTFDSFVSECPRGICPPDEPSETPAERCAQLDAERNERDRLAHRGYDYDGRGDQSYRFEPGETVMRVFDPDRLFETGPDFGLCENCGEPASLIVPGKIPSEVWAGLRWQELSAEEKQVARAELRVAELKAGHRFCSLECQQIVLPDAAGKEKKKPRRTLSCSLCTGPRTTTEPPLDLQGRPTLCTTAHERDLGGCIKYSWLLRDLDADDLARPYITSGPYCPWPQMEHAEPGFTIRQQARPETEQERAEIDRLAAMDAGDGNDINGAARPVTAEPHPTAKESNHHGLSAETRSNQSVLEPRQERGTSSGLQGRMLS
jgi:hypothetical protein